jgi:hypothetical protein
LPWKIERSDFFESRFKRFQKKHENEAKSVMVNLQTYLTSLSVSKHSLTVKHGFLHNEPDGIKAVDQRGGEGNLMETRVYVYPEDETQTLHVMSIGTKQDQNSDIQECRDYVASIKKLRIESKNG